MTLYKLIVAYDGTRFNGFQRQITNQAMMERPSKRPHWDGAGKRKGVTVTVQDCLEDALMGYYQYCNNDNKTCCSVQELCLKFAGRTDKGVHARGQVIAVHLPPMQHDDDEQFFLEEMKKGINSRLPVDISVQDVQVCTDASFDPRRHVQQKVYSYTLKYRRLILDPDSNKALSICNLGVDSIRHAFDSPCLWVCPWALHDDKLPDLCHTLQGSHNFRVFVHKHDRNQRDHTLTVDQIHLERQIVTSNNKDEEEAPIILARLEFLAKGFRRTMIRNLVGFCVDVCRGQIAQVKWDEIWSGKDDVANTINAAPACGLCLENVAY